MTARSCATCGGRVRAIPGRYVHDPRDGGTLLARQRDNNHRAILGQYDGEPVALPDLPTNEGEPHDADRHAHQPAGRGGTLLDARREGARPGEDGSVQRDRPRVDGDSPAALGLVATARRAVPAGGRQPRRPIAPIPQPVQWGSPLPFERRAFDPERARRRGCETAAGLDLIGEL